MTGARVPLAALIAGIIAGTSAAVALPLAAQGAVAPNCAAFDDAVQYRVNPKTSGSLMTPWAAESEQAGSRYGFTEDRGAIFQASIQKDASLVKVHRMFKKSNGDYLFSISASEMKKAAAKGYVDQGTSFSASSKSAKCLVAVRRYRKSAHHQYAASAGTQKALVAAGWTYEGVAFYAAAPKPAAKTAAPTPTPTPTPAPSSAAPTPTPSATPTTPVVPKKTEPTTPPVAKTGDTTFTFAVMPDTQQEVLNAKDPRFINRSKWLVANKDSLDLRFVAHTGDVVNWDNADHSQYKIVDAGLAPLENAGIPYTLSIGNHDTQATNDPGGARDPKRTRILQRDTTTFNAYFNAKRYTDVSGAFEEGKVDNIYATYEEGGTKWMVLVLELWPRKAVVDWAKQVVASHPDYNVMITTHNYIDGSGKIGQSAGYGETSPQYLFDNLVKVYPNIKFTFSGHVGRAASSVSKGIHGNTIVNFNQTMHSNTTNPVRLVQVDMKAGTVTSRLYAPATGETFPQYVTSNSGIDYVW